MIIASLALAATLAAKDVVIYFSAHPDDLEALAGLALRMKDDYDFRVVDFTRGEGGCGPAGFKDGSTARKRMAEERQACAMLGSEPIFLSSQTNFQGRLAFADKAVTTEIEELIMRLKPKAIITHWPVDTHPDHVQCSAAVQHAVFNLRRDRGFKTELYFNEEPPWQTLNFRPTYYVDTTAVETQALALVNCYVCQNGARIATNKAKRMRERGREAPVPVTCAEAYTTFSGERIAGGVLERYAIKPPAPRHEAQDARRPAPYAWRGLMLDVSRHFFTVDEIKKTLDAMAIVGANVFHWHLTDSKGWRIEIARFPELTQEGATKRTSRTRSSTMDADDTDGDYGPFFYTCDEIRAIVRYAAARGIRVVPEIDIPGHSGAATRAYPHLACAHAKGAQELCIGKDETLRFYEQVLDEVLKLFPDEAIHLGGDECNHRRWEKCPDCQKRIRDHALRGEKGLQGWFMNHFARYLEKKGRRMVAWDDVVEFEDLPKSVIVMTYRRKKNLGPAAAARGHDVVSASGYYWDYVQGLQYDPYEYQPFGYACTWKKLMTADPAAPFSPELRGHLLGGEGCMWTELVCDIAGVEWRTWLRQAALTEVLLNGPATNETAFAMKLEDVACRLRRRGVNVAPLGPLFDERPALESGVRCLRQLEDFAKLLVMPTTKHLCFDWSDRKDAYRKVYARRDAGYPSGAYLIDMDWMQIEVTASDDAGFENALRQIRRLARPKKDGVIELPACRLAFGAIPSTRVPLAERTVAKTYAAPGGATLAYRWCEPRHMQLGANYPLVVVLGDEAKALATMDDCDRRNVEAFFCILAPDADAKARTALVDDLCWRMRNLNSNDIRYIK